MGKVAAVLQARMASKRLPGKCLMEILGMPLISVITERLSFSKYIDFTVLATTTNKEDNQLVEFAKKSGLRVYQGSQDDIVDRLYQAGRKFGADIIVRVWGDNPLIDPAIVDMLIKGLLDSDSDYATNTRPASFPLGMNAEIYRLKTLESIMDQTKDPFYREFPKEYIFDSNRFKIETLQNETDLSDINLSVDYEEDLQLIFYIYKELASKSKNFHLVDIMELLSRNENLLNSNKSLPRNIEYKQQLSERKKNIEKGA